MCLCKTLYPGEFWPSDGGDSRQYCSYRLSALCSLVDGTNFSEKICALLRYYTATSGNYLLTFRDNVSVPFSMVKSPDSWPLKIGRIRCPEASINNYSPTRRIIPEERRAHQHRDGSPKSTSEEEISTFIFRIPSAPLEWNTCSQPKYKKTHHIPS
jgi:hypothetical protein